MSEPPKKAIELTIKVNGFNWSEVLDALEDRVRMVRERRENGTGFSACGQGASHSAKVEIRKITQVQFGEESIAWLRGVKEERRFEGAHRIIEETAELFSVSASQVLGEERTKSVVSARHVAAFLIRNRLGLSFPEMGALFKRDHTTMMNAAKHGKRIWEERSAT